MKFFLKEKLKAQIKCELHGKTKKVFPEVSSHLLLLLGLLFGKMRSIT